MKHKKIFSENLIFKCMNMFARFVSRSDKVTRNVFSYHGNLFPEVTKSLKEDELTLSWQVKEKLQDGEVFQILQSTDDENFVPVSLSRDIILIINHVISNLNSSVILIT